MKYKVIKTRIRQAIFTIEVDTGRHCTPVRQHDMNYNFLNKFMYNLQSLLTTHL